MPRSVNEVTLIGNVTRDPVMRETLGKQKIVTFGVATNREWMGPEGKKSLAEYHNVCCWGRLAELCMELLKKGTLVYIKGYLKTRSWDHESGIKVYRTETVAQDMILLSARGNNFPKGNEEEEVNPAGGSEHEEAPFEDDDFFADLSEKEAGQSTS